MEKILKVVCICLAVMIYSKGYTVELPDISSELNHSKNGSLTNEVNENRNMFSANEDIISMNYPNPFRSTTTIFYKIRTPGNVILTIFDLIGREVCRYDEGFKQIGESEKKVVLNYLSSGVYIYEIKIDSRRVALNKFMIIK
ncbi:MAG: T9SS type A sorting domain-containing protein [Ignavibacteria bacterium]